ncbi:hypothetical protein BH09BAC3_BH09BAC3_35180 [soil metagenome]
MKKYAYRICFCLLLVTVVSHFAQAQMPVVPEGVKVDRLGRDLQKIELPIPLTDIVVNASRQLFQAPPCLDGEYYVGFQLYYDLGDKNTTMNWNTHLQIELFNGGTSLWTKPLDIQMLNQNFISTIFHDQSISCSVNYTFKVTQQTLTGTVPTGNIYLKVVMYKKHQDDFDPAAALTLTCTPGSGGKETALSWSYAGNSALEYDVEWVFIESHEGFTGSTAAQAFAFKQAAGITTAAGHYTHTTFYPAGKIWYRVRAVGYKELNPEHRILGQWFYGPCAAITISNQQSDMTWQEQTVFAEDGKFKKVISYYDGSLRQRQVQTNLSTNNVTLVGESMYDFEGRQSVNFLPAPATNNDLTYRPNFNRFVPTPDGHNKYHYDNGRLANTPANNSSGVSNYYSASSPLGTVLRDYIPNAEGYVYSQTEYLQDGKGYVSRTSGVGETFKIDGDHAARNYYGQASQTELIRLFGKNVGNASHYKKQLVVDNNGQVSVTYVDQEGRTIATALGGGSPSNVDALPSYNPTSITVDISSKNQQDNSRSLTVHKILNEGPNTPYTFTYSMAALAAQVSPFGCQSCIYDLKIMITDPNGASVNLGTISGNQSPDAYSYQRTGITAASCTTATTASITFSFALAEIGDYTITKSLIPRVPSMTDLKAVVAANSSVQALIAQLNTAYIVDATECVSCVVPNNCSETDGLINETILEVATRDCQSLYNKMVQNWKLTYGAQGQEPQLTDLVGDAQYCNYLLCTKNIQSDIFDKHMARIVDWNAAVAGGYADMINADPFFNTAGLDGVSYKSTMQTKLNTIALPSIPYDSNNDGTSDGSTVYTGDLFAITDPENTTYYINDHGVHDVNGYHILYRDLMLRRSEPTYQAQVDAARWAMVRGFYLEKKRLTKLGITNYTQCVSAIADLNTAGTIPDTKQKIIDALAASGLTAPATNELLRSTIWGITTKCGITLTTQQNTDITEYLRAYFDNYHNSGDATGDNRNYFRLIFTSDLSTNPKLIAINNILSPLGCSLASVAVAAQPICITKTSNRQNLIVNPDVLPSSTANCGTIFTFRCFPDWVVASGVPKTDAQHNIILSSQACSSSSDAIRGSLVQPLVSGKEYTLRLKYKTTTSRVDALIVQLSHSTAFTKAAVNPQAGQVINGETQPPCLQAHATTPDNVLLYGYPYPYNFVHQVGNITNQEFQSVSVNFTAQAASTYFFVYTTNLLTPTSPPTNGQTQTIVVRDLVIEPLAQDSVVCLNYVNSDAFTRNIDWASRCIQNANAERTTLIALATDRILEEQANKLYASYSCLDAVNETLSYTYSSKEHHYTLYYYDQSGSLVQTVPPKGVVPLTPAQVQNFSTTPINPAHTLITNYRYNTYNQLFWQNTPDAGVSEFWYNDKSQLRLSRNAKQLPLTKFSYSKYDALGRVTETGELTSAMTVPTIPAAIADPAFPLQASNTLSDITWNYYDLPDLTIQAQFAQGNLRNRVSYVEVTDAQLLPGNSQNLKTYFSYDIHGNVKAVWQVIPGLPSKRIDYLYDLVSNKVNYVFYQFGAADQFAHRYSYDADNRIIETETSTDRFMWNTEAGYEYYRHGPLARTQLGEHNVQGLDYYYTLQGWIKGVNMPYAGDPGADGIGLSVVGKDAVSYTLGYYENDYKPVNASVAQSDSRDYLWDRLNTQMGHRGLFNGNISWMITDLAKQGDLQSDRKKGMQAMLYKYDQLHRIKASQSLTTYSTTTGFARATPAPYDETYTYDPNGNLLTLNRKDAAGAVMDDFNYAYYTGTNRLSGVKPITEDKSITSGQLMTDSKVYRNITISGSAYVAAGTTVEVRATQSITHSPNFNVPLNGNYWAHIVGGTYQYDEIGNLIADNEKGVKIKWTPQGKVREVNVNNSTVVTSFRYDAMGNRVEKKVVQSSGTVITRYVRDASGNVMSVYNDTNMIEQPIYGSSRLGQYIGGGQEGKEILGLRKYELTNHLGNVLSTITDNVNMSGANNVTAKVESTSDYYPFGLEMAGRTWKDPAVNYRYGFNGKENDNEVKGNGNQQDYGLRIYDPRLGRFLSVDPLAASFAWNSPYCFAENSPIWGIDLDGGEFRTYLDKFKKAAQELKKETYKQIEQKTNAAASAALIKTAQTIYPGVEKANETIKQAQFKSNPENSVAILLYEFATGTGKDNRTFNYGEKGSFANSFVQGRVLTEVQSDFAGKMSEMTASEFAKDGTIFGLEFSPDHAGLQESVEKHMDSNLPQFFVGGANVSVSATGDANWVNVSITNPTSRGSLMLHQGENYPRDGKDGGTEKPLSTISQTFTFKMKIDPSKFKQEEKKK